MPIDFFVQIDHFKFSNKRIIKSWIITCSKKEAKQIDLLNIVFCSDDYLHELNLTYLRHDTLTDIVTFDYSNGNKIAGEIFISIDRVLENSAKYSTEFSDELHRVIIHGVLHLCGYKDKKKGDKVQMRKKEDSYLSLLEKMFHVKRL
jgi:probable rRNA maturation factor